jgi:hypothetical protein
MILVYEVRLGLSLLSLKLVSGMLHAFICRQIVRGLWNTTTQFSGVIVLWTKKIWSRMIRCCQMVTVFLALPKLMILAGFLHLKMCKCWCKGVQFLRKQSLLNVAHTLHIWDFRLNIFPGWCVPKAEINILIFYAEYSWRNLALCYTVHITYTLVL